MTDKQFLEPVKNQQPNSDLIWFSWDWKILLCGMCYDGILMGVSSLPQIVDSVVCSKSHRLAQDLNGVHFLIRHATASNI